MKSNKINIYIGMLGLVLLAITGCTKDALKQKQDIHTVVATTIDDYQQLLDGTFGQNGSFQSINFLGEAMCDNVFMPDEYLAYFTNDPVVENIVTWKKDLFSQSTSVPEWDGSYQTILIANIVIDGLKQIPITSANRASWNVAEGDAYLMRGLEFLNLAGYWAQPYQSKSENTDLGIPLRLTSNINEKITRSSVSQTYTQVINDFKTSLQYLPNSSASNSKISKIRGSKAAAYGFLARTYLIMQDYANTKLYADSALQLYSALLDYNQVAANGYFNQYNEEIVFNADDDNSSASNISLYNIVDPLVQSYTSDDLRSTLFIQQYNPPAYNYGSTYDGDDFTGLANDEIYLTRAEANARLGNTSAAMTDLNTLLVTRWKTGTYTPYTASNAADALNQILVERRKELLSRGTRWTDLRRLNLDPKYAVNISRVVKGQTYTLPANDSRYTLQIPPYVIRINGIQQNP